MNSMQEQPRWLTDKDLPEGWTRDPHHDFRWIDPLGVHYAYQQRKAARRTRGERRQRAVVVMRKRLNYRPTTVEGAAVRSVLEHREWASYDDVAAAVERWADGNPEEFIHRAVNDRGALLSILIRLDN